MWSHISLTLQNTILILYAFSVCRSFLPLRPCFHHKLLTGVSVIVLPILFFFCPDSFFSYVSLTGIISMIYGCLLFFRGSFREKSDLLIYIYLTGIFVEATFCVTLIILDFLFPKAGLVIVSFYSSNHGPTFVLYSLHYLIVFFLLYRIVLPIFKKYRYSFQNTKIFRNLEYTIFIVFLSSNIFPLLFLSRTPTGISIPIYFVFSMIAMLYILKNCRIFTYQETQIHMMNLKQKQLADEVFSYRRYEKRLQEMKKQNHDISNHLLTLSLLAEQERWQEIEAYISSITAASEKE